jgi:hypothetical protein
MGMNPRHPRLYLLVEKREMVWMGEPRDIDWSQARS